MRREVASGVRKRLLVVELSARVSPTQSQVREGVEWGDRVSVPCCKACQVPRFRQGRIIWIPLA